MCITITRKNLSSSSNNSRPGLASWIHWDSTFILVTSTIILISLSHPTLQVQPAVEDKLEFCTAPVPGESESVDHSCGINNKNNWNNKMGEVGIERERTFIMIKPDGVQRGLVGEIIKRFEQKGFKLVGLKFQWADEALLHKHYAEHLERPFFPPLVKYMSSGPVVPMVWEGLNVVTTGRQMLGATNPSDSLPGTIRGDFCILTGRNVVHGSDSVDSANREISLWFTQDELVKWKANQDPWLYE